MADAEKALKYIIRLSRHLQVSDVRSIVTLVLIDLDFSEHLDGFKFLRQAITLFLEYPERTMMKVIYTDVGRSFVPRVRKDQVERSIRTAIRDAWKIGNIDRWRMFFPVDSSGNVSKPCNSKFIARIGNLIEVWQVCKEVAVDE